MPLLSSKSSEMILRVMAHIACVLFHGDFTFQRFIIWNVVRHKFNEVFHGHSE